MAKINLENRLPNELKKLLDTVKTSNLEFNEKKLLIERIENKLGILTRDHRKEKAILASIEEGMADITDIGN